MSTLEDHLRRHGNAFALVSKESGVQVSGEEVGERHKYTRDALFFVDSFKRHMNNYGNNLIRYITGKEPKAYMKKKLQGLGSVRIDNPNRHGDDRAGAATYLDLNYIVSNGYGSGFAESIDQFAEAFSTVLKAYGINQRMSYTEAREYILNHELVHFTSVISEADVEARLAQYFTTCAKKAKKPEARKKYAKMAVIAHLRAHAHGHGTHQGGNHIKTAPYKGKLTQPNQKSNPQNQKNANQNPNQNQQPQYRCSSPQYASRGTSQPNYQARTKNTQQSQSYRKAA